MAKGFYMVRAEIPDPADRPKFEAWYAQDHLPWAAEVMGATCAWRAWSLKDPAVHFAFYEFGDGAAVAEITDSDRMQPLFEDFDRVWGDRVTRKRDVIEVAQELKR